MEELAPERSAVKEALLQLRIDAWTFEADAGARPNSVRETFLEEIGAADLYIGLFWKELGDYTQEEFEHARRLQKTVLVYEKRIELHGRHPRLQSFLDELGRVDSGLTVR